MPTPALRLLPLAAFFALAGPAASQVLNPNNGHYYISVPGGIPWDQAKTSAENTSFLGVQGHLVFIDDAAENAWVYGSITGIGLDRYWLGGFQDMTVADYAEPGGGWRWTNGDTLAFAQWNPGEPNDFGGNEHYLAFDDNPNWNDAPLNWQFNAGFIIEYDVGGVGTSYCLSTVNSTGSAAEISATGTLSVANNDLVLHAQPVPDQPGLFYYGPAQTQVPFGNGFRCVDGVFGRLGATNASNNVLTWNLDVTNPPSAQTVITAGSTWNFQAWFRDPAAGGAFFNLSDGLELPFVP